MPKFRLLDLCGGDGGCARGYMQAGFLVVSVDIKPHPRNVAHRFVQADALEFASRFGHMFDALHWSVPCQSSTTASNRWRGKGGKADSHTNLIPDAQRISAEVGKPYVIENVPGARRWLRNPVTIRGGSFGLLVDRPRLFEVNFPLPKPVVEKRGLCPIGVYGALDGRRLTQHPRSDGTHQYAPRTLAEAQAAMGIDWMEWEALKEAVPPAYTCYIGRHLARHLVGVPKR